MGGAADSRTPLPSLAVVRLLPAFTIFTAHVTQFRLFADDTTQAWSSGFLNKAGYESVSFFIVLSGFILTWVVRPTGPDRVFLTKRFMKIYPTHVVTWALCLALFGGGTLIANSLNLLLLHSWAPAAQVFFTANIPAWTLCVEVLFYATFGFWFTRLRVASDRRIWVVVCALTLIVILLPYLLMPLPDGRLLVEPAFTRAGVVTPVSEWKFWIIYIFPPTRLAEAVLGMSIALLVQRGAWPRLPLPVVAISLVLAVVVATRELPLLAATSSITIVPIALLIGGLASSDITGKPTLLRSPRLAPLAKYTFNFYLAQWAVIWFWHQHASSRGYPTGEGVSIFIALLCTTSIFAALLHHVVERPVTDAAVRHVRRRAATESTSRQVSPSRPAPSR